MASIIGISGSLREASYNTALLRAARELAPAGTEIAIERLHGLPAYDGDVEQADGLPERALELQEAIGAADGLLLASPEYNAGVPGVAKNAIDWISRGDRGDVLKDKPVALIGGGGRGGTRYSQGAWLPTMRYFGARIYTEKTFFAAGVWSVFDDEGRLTDETTRKLLGEVVEGFVAFCER